MNSKRLNVYENVFGLMNEPARWRHCPFPAAYQSIYHLGCDILEAPCLGSGARYLLGACHSFRA
jgi:hypothetical protein